MAALAAIMLLLAGCPRGVGDSLSVTGQIEGITADAGSKVGGRVAEVLVREGDPVKAGDVLVRLEDAEVAAALAAARAKLAQAGAQLSKVETGARAEEILQAEAALNRQEEQYQMALKGAREEDIRAAEALAASARAARDNAASKHERASRLFAEGAVSQQMHDDARDQLEGAEAQLRAAVEQLKALQSGTRDEEVAMAKAARDQAAAFLAELREGAREEDITTARALRDEAAAAVTAAEAQLREMTVVSPMDGVVEAIDVEPGDLVKPGAVARVSDPENLELKVFVSAEWLGHLRTGSPVRITTDSLGAEAFEGTLSFIATQGEFTPRNLQTEEQRIRQMFAVKIDLHSHGGKLKAGMSATAHFSAGGSGEGS
jgi:HlyD family secretion protein